MSVKLRREKDIISRVTADYQTAATTQYAKYLSGSPVYVTYYQFFAPGSTTDNSLEAVHSMTNSNSPNLYKVIEDFPLYGLGNLDIENALTERGLESLINSTLIVGPQTIIPTTSDFLCFQVDGMERELFEITNVTFDRVHANRYYQIEINLYKENVDEIFENCLEDLYVFNETDNNGVASGSGASDGGISGSIITKDQQEVSDTAQNLYDTLLDQFQKLFYDPEMDQFVYRTYDKNRKVVNYWSPYLQKFLYETKIMSRYSKEIMTEFYIRDINSWDFGDIVFNDYCWDHCIYKAVLTESKLEVGQEFIEVSNNDLRLFKTLPFFCSQYEYKMINFETHPAFWMDAFHMSLEPYSDEAKIGYLDGKTKLNYIGSPEGTIVYEDNNYPPTEIYKIKNGDLVSFSLTNGVTDDIILNIVSSIMNGTFDIHDKNIIISLNEYSYKKSLQLYLLMPIVLYGIKKSIDGLAT